MIEINHKEIAQGFGHCSSRNGSFRPNLARWFWPSCGQWLSEEPEGGDPSGLDLRSPVAASGTLGSVQCFSTSILF